MTDTDDAWRGWLGRRVRVTSGEAAGATGEVTQVRRYGYTGQVACYVVLDAVVPVRRGRRQSFVSAAWLEPTSIEKSEASE